MTEKDLYARLSENMKCFRKKKKLTQFELAEKIDVSEMTIKKIETEKQWPSGKTLALIATALEVDLYELFLPVPSSFKIDKKITQHIQDALREGYKEFIKNNIAEAVK